jgi:hypothetical protein
MRRRFMRVSIPFLKFCALAAALCAFAADSHAASFAQRVRARRPVARARRWHAPTYRGITLGRSTRADVRRVFGKPIWSGHPEDEYDNSVLSMLRDEFENVAGFRGRTAVNIRGRGRVVESIELYPPPDAQPIFEEVAAEFGTDYVERPVSLGICPTEAELRAYRPRAVRDSLVFRVYPQKGYYIAVEGGRVREIVFLKSCP